MRQIAVSKQLQIVIPTVFALVLGLLFYRLVAADETCGVVSSDQQTNYYSINFRGQRIDIIGWYHGGMERDYAQLKLAESVAAGQHQKCEVAQEILQSALNRVANQKVESQRVLNKLSEIYSKKKFSNLGLPQKRWTHSIKRYNCLQRSRPWKKQRELSVSLQLSLNQKLLS